MNELSTQKKPMGPMPWIWLALAVIYDISPVDIIPDIPVIGWVDDFYISSIALLNLVQKYFGENNSQLARIFRVLKIIVIILAVISILLLLLLGAVIVKIITGM